MEISKEIKELNKQLYPTGRAWGFVHGSEQVDTEVVRFIDALGNPFVDGFGNPFIQTYGTEASPSKRLINAFLKSHERAYSAALSLQYQILADNDKFDEVDAANWERVYGITQNGLTLEERKANILRRQSYPSGVAERCTKDFIQAELNKAGFFVTVTENRFKNADYWNVQTPVAGFTICANAVDEQQDAKFYDVLVSQSEMGLCEMGVNEMIYLQTPPSDLQLRSTFFISGAEYPNKIDIPINRKDEFRQLVLKLKPLHTVAYLYINYI